VGNLGGEQAEGGEALVFAEGVFALENTRVEAGVLQGDGTEGGEGGEESFLVVVETVQPLGKDGEDAEDFALVILGRS